MANMDVLFQPGKVGSVEVKNRIFMAPLTRNRAQQPGNAPGPMNREYYVQRASAGLIITEGTAISQQGVGYAYVPGIYTDEQEAGWKDVVNGVHAAGGRICLQLWHVGRISHHVFQENNQPPVAPSAIQASANTQIPNGQPGGFDLVPTDKPRALDTSEIPGIIDQFVQATRRARRAGFDMVEIHSANGYLLNQFLAPNANQRTDQYGGSMQNRARIVLEVVDAVAAEIGNERTGIRFSPFGTFNDINNPEAGIMSEYIAGELDRRKIAYVHLAEPDWAGGPHLSDEYRQSVRDQFSGFIILAGGYTPEDAADTVARGLADAIAFGRQFIANPDLPARIRRGGPYNEPERATFYGGNAHGYTDYPALQGA